MPSKNKSFPLYIIPNHVNLSAMKLLSIGSDAKTVKGEKFGVMTGIQYLAPANVSGFNTCPNASEGCKAACLFTAGFAGVYATVNKARIEKTLFFFQNRAEYGKQLLKEIAALVKKAAKANLIPAVRLNGTSDLAWESIKFDGKSVMEHFPTVQFYDYTKSADRAKRHAAGQLPANYHLTFSRSESNQAEVLEVLAAGGNVAVVFRDSLPKECLGKLVIDGDESDLRFNDPKGVIVGLKQKGKAKSDNSGFVV